MLLYMCTPLLQLAFLGQCSQQTISVGQRRRVEMPSKQHKYHLNHPLYFQKYIHV